VRRVEVAGIGNVRLIEADVPVAGPGELLVRTRSVGICGSDLHAIDGSHPFIDLPYWPGHEVVGVVETAPEGSGFARGERVLVEPNLVCRSCRACRSGRYNLCEKLAVFGCQTPGAMADYFEIGADRVHRVPAGMSDAAAALVEPLSTAVHAGRTAGSLEGARVVVLGAGPVGLLTMLVARDSGAAEIVVTDLLPAKRERATRLGADAAVAADDPNAVEQIRGRFGGAADVVFDCVSNQASISQAIELALSGGRVIVIGVAQGSVSVPLHLMQDREVALTGSAMYVGDDVRGAIALMERGVIPVDELVTATFDLGDAVEAFEVARGREQVKVQLTVRPAD
jgi:2-desacetyl-2-hydroxyethyl bacteriochlorophyllide A dehydrogenase